ncbi:MAG: hypothetical protein ABWY20_04530, partial [Mycobacterium sp.]
MKTLGLLSPRQAVTIGRAIDAGDKHSLVMSSPYDLRASRTDLMMARKWSGDEDDRRPRRAREASVAKGSVPDGGAVDELEGSDWDEVADVICAGRGRLGLAVAVAVQRAGLDVMLADGPGPAAGGPAPEAAGHLAGLLGV